MYETVKYPSTDGIILFKVVKARLRTEAEDPTSSCLLTG